MMNAGKVHILLVDDDPGDCRLVKLALAKSPQAMEFTIETAESLAQALKQLKDYSFDLVLLDLTLPDSQGLETVDDVCQPYPHVPVVVLTGLADEDLAVKAIKMGASDYLVKDGHFQSLLVRTIRYSLERKRVKEDLRQAKEAAEAANVAKSEFLANMSHELRTPLNAILGFSELLAHEELAAEHKEWSNTINRSGKNLLALVEDILDFSKIEAGKLKTEISACSLEEILADVDSLLRPQATKKGLEFNISPRANLPQIIGTDPVRLRQCLVNLINNAIKFTEKGHVCVRVLLENRDSPLIRFDVEDTGIGIGSDEQELIFESFAQVDSSASRKYEGTGLGLAITKRLAEMLGGEILIQSELGKGSIFSLIIPNQLEDAFEVTTKQDEAEPEYDQFTAKIA